MASALPSLDEFAGLRIAGLDSYDVLALNYCAASGLPGTDRSSLDQWLDKRDDWVQQVRVEICRRLYRFDPQSSLPPTECTYGNSLARFLCYFLLQVLQEDCGVRYHPQRKFNPGFCKPLDVFAHGIMDDEGEGGACASMPVVYVSVGRRLGFPLYLVEAKGHLFFRWHDPHGTTLRWETPDLTLWVPPDRFNVDGSGEGIGYHDDAFYLTWPEVLTEADLAHGRYLRSMTAKEVLASFLMERGECFWDFGMIGEALKSYHAARQIVPDDERYNQHHEARFQQYELSRFWLAEHRRTQKLRLRNGSMHAPGCACLECEQSRNQPRRQFPLHGSSCQCAHCQQDRQAANRTPIPGHPPGCRCAACGRPVAADHFISNLRKTIPGFPGIPGF